ncbi:alpha/beta hydrolase [Ciceribacter sp. L1K23]|nr:alpha/beta hydrolase [Ciceribacter sp. L1K23]
MAAVAFEETFIKTSDGLTLHARSYGPEGAARTVVCLAGLTRNGRDFHQLAEFLSSDLGLGARVVAIDSRGRGLSDRDKDKSRYNLVVEANDVLDVCDHLEIEHAHFIGTSRGGLLLHLMAGLRPALLASVTLNDVGPVLDLEGLQQIQAYLGQKRSPPRDWDEAVAAVKHDHAASFPLLGDNDWGEMARALYRETDGRPVADYDPAIGEQFAAADFSQPLPDLWPQFDAFGKVPMMVIRGEHSRLLSKATVAEMAERHPKLVAVTATGQGHAPILHLGGLERQIRDFLRNHA